MKSNVLFRFIIVLGLMFVSTSFYKANAETLKNKTAKQPTISYTCNMHPDVSQDKPGKCPKCGAKMVEKKLIANGNTKSKNSKHLDEKVLSDSTSKNHKSVGKQHQTKDFNFTK